MQNDIIQKSCSAIDELTIATLRDQRNRTLQLLKELADPSLISKGGRSMDDKLDRARRLIKESINWPE